MCVGACAKVHKWRSEVNFCRVCSLRVYMGPGDQIQIARLVRQASLPLELSLWPSVWVLTPVSRLVWNWGLLPAASQTVSRTVSEIDADPLRLFQEASLECCGGSGAPWSLPI